MRKYTSKMSRRHSFKQRCWHITVLPTYENGIEATYLVPTHELNKEQRRLLLREDITWKEIIESELFEIKVVSTLLFLILDKYDLESNSVDNVYRGRKIKDILKKNSVVNMLIFYSYNPDTK